MACGLPIIATKWRGIPGVVSDEDNGLLVDANDDEGLRSAVLRLANSATERIKLGTKGRKLYRDNFTTPTHISNIKELFVKAVASIK